MDHSPSTPPPRLTMKAFWRDFGDEVFSLDRGLPWTLWPRRWPWLMFPAALAKDAALQPQPLPPPRLTMKSFWHDFAEEVLSLERGLPWTFARLCVRPGALVRRYVAERDPRIVKPLRYFLIGFAVAALAFQGFGGSESARESFMRGAGEGQPNHEAMLAMWAVVAQMEWLFLVVVMPSLSAALCLAFRRHKPDFAEMWVLCLFLLGHALLLDALVLVLDEWGRIPGTAVAALVVPFGLFLATCIGYFPGTLAARLARSLLAALLGALFTLLGMLAIVMGVGLVRGAMAAM